MDHLIIQVEERRVLAARFRFSGRTAVLAGAAEFAVADEQDLASIAGRIAEGGPTGQQVVLSLPPALFAQRSVELSLGEARKVRDVLPALLQGEIALPTEEAVFEAIPSIAGRYLAVWARRSEIARAITLFREAGLEPRYVTSAPLVWTQLPGVSPDCALTDGRALAVLAGGRLAFVRAFGGGDALQELRATLAAAELSGVSMPDRLLVFGEQAGVLAGGAELPMAVERLELPEELGGLFRNDETFHQLAGSYAQARACAGGTLPDFRRGDLAWTAGDKKLRRKLVLTAVLATVLVLLLFAYQGWKYRTARKDLASLNTSIASLYREIFPTRAKAVDEVAEVKGEIRKLAGVDTAAGFLDLLKQVAEAKGAGINGLYEAELEGRAVRLKGDARSAQAATEFRNALAPFLASAELGEVKGRPDGSVTFSLVGTLKEVKR